MAVEALLSARPVNPCVFEELALREVILDRRVDGATAPQATRSCCLTALGRVTKRPDTLAGGDQPLPHNSAVILRIARTFSLAA